MQENKLYVEGINYDASEKDLQDAFAEAGKVIAVSIVMDKVTGRSRGFGFVDMATPEEAQKAIEVWNGREFMGRTLVVNQARPKTASPRPGVKRPHY